MQENLTYKRGIKNKRQFCSCFLLSVHQEAELDHWVCFRSATQQLIRGSMAGGRTVLNLHFCQKIVHTEPLRAAIWFLNNYEQKSYLIIRNDVFRSEFLVCAESNLLFQSWSKTLVELKSWAALNSCSSTRKSAWQQFGVDTVQSFANEQSHQFTGGCSERGFELS